VANALSVFPHARCCAGLGGPTPRSGTSTLCNKVSTWAGFLAVGGGIAHHRRPHAGLIAAVPRLLAYIFYPGPFWFTWVRTVVLPICVQAVYTGGVVVLAGAGAAAAASIADADSAHVRAVLLAVVKLRCVVFRDRVRDTFYAASAISLSRRAVADPYTWIFITAFARGLLVGGIYDREEGRAVTAYTLSFRGTWTITISTFGHRHRRRRIGGSHFFCC